MIRESALFFQVILAIATLSAGGFAQPAAALPSCEPSPEVGKALRQLPNYREEPTLTDWQVYQQRIAKLQTLMTQYPNDVFIQRTYIESGSSLRGVDKASVEQRAKIDAQYKALHEQQPDNAQVDFLYGVTLMGRDTPQAIKLFEAALSKDPGFGLPHLYLRRIYNSEVFLDKQKSLDHLKAFLDGCPATFEGYASLSWSGDKDLQANYAGKLRTILEKRTDPDAVGGYQTLWEMEFKTHPSSEYAVLGKQVAHDLERLRKLNLEDNRDWYGTLEDGYKLANDQKQADWAKEEREKRFPPTGQLPDKMKWHKDHPQPDAEASAATRQAYYRDVLNESEKWLKERTASALVTFNILEDRVNAMEHLDDVPASEVVKTVEQMIMFGGENGGGSPWSSDFSPWSSDYRHGASVLSKKHIAPERVVDYAQKGLAIMEVEFKEPTPDLYATKENVADYKFYQGYSRLEMLKYETGGYLGLKQADRAAPLLAEMDQRIQDLKALAGDKEDRKQGCGRWLADYWGMRAQEAEVRGRKQDAMSFYENGLLTRLDAKAKPPTNEKDELAENAHRLWTSLNGTEEGWQLWYGRRTNDLANQSGFTWEKANEALPAFELADLNDKKWNLNSLKGKVTLISFWATWCGPCREELPHLQKLMDQYKDRPDVQFISLNMDDNPGLIQPFLKEQKLSMVVIPATTYVTETLKAYGIPQNWIVDTQGTVRMKNGGYDASEKWVSGMQSAIEEVKSAEAPVSTGGRSK
jgi:thiol-disulfide isomerase/thioredoxin